MTVSNKPPLKIGFLGAGQMACALAKGWIAAGLLPAEHCRASDPSPEARSRFEQATGIVTLAENAKVVAESNVLILAVKPQTMGKLLEELRHTVTGNHLLISIAAGISIKQMIDTLAASYRIIRVMPNTPSLVGCSAAGFAVSPAATPEDAALVEQLFNAVGKAYRLPESSLDAVTGLSGSGPAYVYILIEALSDGGVRMGLPRDVAMALATQTVLGAAKMVAETGLHPAALKDAVTSPGGTTIAGIHALERAGFRAALMDAVEAATKRSAELGKG